LNFFIRSRNARSIAVGLYAADKARLGASAIMIREPEIARSLEIGASLRIEGGRVEYRSIVPARAEIIPFAGRLSPKIDGLDSATCKRLAQLFDTDYFAKIAATPALLDQTRYSAQKRALIIKACEREAAVDALPAAAERRVIDALMHAGLGRARARSIADKYEPAALARDPYAPLFDGELTFLRADRFARRFAPKAAAKLRPQALIAATLRALAENEGDTLVSEGALYAQAWRDYGMIRAEFDDALATLRAKGLVRLVGNPAPAPTPAAETTDTPWREIPPLEGEERADAPAYGLKNLIEAERFIFDRVNEAGPAPNSVARVETVEKIIAGARQLCGFALDADQAQALRSIFAHKFSIITGPPGSGKTAVMALANLAASEICGDRHETPIRGVALAGRAASTLGDAASIGGSKFDAMTIHRAFGLAPDAGDVDETPKAKKTVSCGVLIIDEASMINAQSLATILGNTEAEHIVFVGDVDQLPPIGPAAPFADMIARGLAPVTRLKGAYRSDDENIRDFLAYVREGGHGRRGGSDFIPAPSGARGALAGERWQELIKSGAKPHDIAVITPQNVGDDGTKALNLDIRRTLNLPDKIAVGDMLMATRNDYRAPLAESEETTEIFNGERAMVVHCGDDFIDAEFSATGRSETRIVRFLSDGEPPENTAYGYAMTAHKAQGSQFAHVVMVTSPSVYFQSRASIYTAASRARQTLVTIGDEGELERVIGKADRRRVTYLARGE
jgi:AAA domain/UvrD-like helicase C-terminal domain/Helix-hairpin-helix containing domain